MTRTPHLLIIDSMFQQRVGFSLIEVLIVVGIMSVVILINLAVFQDMHRQLSLWEHRQDRDETERLLESILAPPNDYCSCQFNAGTNPDEVNLIFSALTASPTVEEASRQVPNLPLGLSDIHGSCDLSKPPLYAVGQKFSSGLTVQSIDIASFEPLGTGAIPGPFIATLEMNLQSQNNMRIKPAKVKLNVNLANETGAISIASCGSPIGMGPAGRVNCDVRLGSGKNNYRTFSLAASNCYLTKMGTDQSSSGHSNCYTELTTSGTWKMVLDGNKGWIVCAWTCFDAVEPLPPECTPF